MRRGILCTQLRRCTVVDKHARDFEEMTRIYGKLELLNEITLANMHYVMAIPDEIVQDIKLAELSKNLADQMKILEAVQRDVDRFTQHVRRGG